MNVITTTTKFYRITGTCRTKDSKSMHSCSFTLHESDEDVSEYSNPACSNTQSCPPPPPSPPPSPPPLPPPRVVIILLIILAQTWKSQSIIQQIELLIKSLISTSRVTDSGVRRGRLLWHCE